MQKADERTLAAGMLYLISLLSHKPNSALPAVRIWAAIGKRLFHTVVSLKIGNRKKVIPLAGVAADDAAF